MKFLLIAVFTILMSNQITIEKNNLSGVVGVVCDVETCDTGHDF